MTMTPKLYNAIFAIYLFFIPTISKSATLENVEIGCDNHRECTITIFPKDKNSRNFMWVKTRDMIISEVYFFENGESIPEKYLLVSFDNKEHQEYAKIFGNMEKKEDRNVKKIFNGVNSFLIRNKNDGSTTNFHVNLPPILNYLQKFNVSIPDRYFGDSNDESKHVQSNEESINNFSKSQDCEFVNRLDVLSKDTELFSLNCNGGNTNVASDLYIAKSGTILPIEFFLPNQNDFTETLFNVEYDKQKKAISFISKGNYDVTCGQFGRYDWDGQKFVLEFFSAMDKCGFVPFKYWPVYWSPGP